MAVKSISALKAEAKAKGVPTSLIRENLASASKLEALIAEYGKGGNAKKGKAMATKAIKARKAVRKATRTRAATKARTTARTATRTSAQKRTAPQKRTQTKQTTQKRTTRRTTVEAPKRRGRPPGSKNRVQNPQPRKGATKPKISNNGDAGRFQLENIDWWETEGWNPRPGSPPDLIIKAVRKVANKRSGTVDREKVFDRLAPQAKSFLTNRASDRSKAAAEKMLRYRISRIMWQFAIQTGQHEISENRADYGTAGTGEGIWKPKKATKAQRTTSTTRKPARKPTGRAQTAPKPRGRPKGSRTTPTRQKAAQSRTRTPVKRGPGRPKGSKNKTTARTATRTTTKRRTRR